MRSGVSRKSHEVMADHRTKRIRLFVKPVDLTAGEARRLAQDILDALEDMGYGDPKAEDSTSPHPDTYTVIVPPVEYYPGDPESALHRAARDSQSPADRDHGDDLGDERDERGTITARHERKD